MVYVGSALKQEEIKSTLEEIGFKFVSKKGIKLAFEHEGMESAEAVAKAKTAIKGTSYGKVLYFSVKDTELGV